MDDPDVTPVIRHHDALAVRAEIRAADARSGGITEAAQAASGHVDEVQSRLFIHDQELLAIWTPLNPQGGRQRRLNGSDVLS